MPINSQEKYSDLKQKDPLEILPSKKVMLHYLTKKSGKIGENSTY